MKETATILVLAAMLCAGMGLSVFSGDSVSAARAVTTGDLRCNQVQGCSGSAGCNGAGSISDPCILECVDGTTVLCNVKTEE